MGDQLKQDILFAVRMLSKNRTFSVMALATVALGIGSTTAVFSLVDGVLLRPLPFPAADRLFHADDVEMRGPFDTLRANSRLADYAAHLGVRSFNTMGHDQPERLKGSEVSANFFDVLGAKPLLGRTFAADEDRPGKLRAVVLSHKFWTQQYGARPDALGGKFTIDEAAYEIVGVMPEGFQYPTPAAKFWIPMRLDPRIAGAYWSSGGLSVFLRLRDGVRPEAAAAELRAWIPRIRGMFPWRMPDAWGTGAGLTELRDHLVAGIKLRSFLLLGVVALVLLIAIVNVANLTIGQTATRQRELAVRSSLGASSGRLIRQLLTEAAVLAAAGGMLGTLLAFGQLILLKQLLPADTPRLHAVEIDARVLAFTAPISLGSGFIFGLLPAWRIRKSRLLSGEANRSTPPRTDAGLVMTESAFATILLVAAGLLLRSLWSMLQVDPGFQVSSIVTAELSPGPSTTRSLERTMALYDRVRDTLAAYPGVTNVAAMNVLPLTPEQSAFTAVIEDHPLPPDQPQIALWSTAVTPEHIETLGIGVLQGRSFTSADRGGAPPVVLIDKATAQRYWPGENPIGKHLRPIGQKDWRTIVGVVDEVKNYSITGPPKWVGGEVYLPLAQALSTPTTLSLIARVTGTPDDFEARLPALIRDVCANCAISKIARMQTVVANAVEAPRSIAWLVGGFAILALGLSAAGIFGVVSHGVHRRTRELGVRIALGASRGRIAWSVVGSSLGYTMLGTIAGLAASLTLARLIASLLYQVPAHDLMSFAVPPAALAVVALAASIQPLYRALKIDPAQALRA